MNRKRMVALFVILAMILPPFSVPAAVAAAVPTVGVHVTNKVDVALAVGPTYVDYSNFEADLRQKLEAKNPAMPREDLYITAARAVNNNMTSAFQWWAYDHTNFNGVEEISDAKHVYTEKNEGERSAHPYNNFPAHMKESNNGATMDFYGYPRGGYIDFRFLDNDQATKKTFEFAIQEDLAYDALDGVGFLFNTDITGAYGAGQKINGYLLFLEYSGSGSGQAMKIYKLKDMDAKRFHHSRDKGGMNYFGTANVELIAYSNVYSPVDKFRRIKLEARPGSIKAWYRGSHTDTSVLVTPIAEADLPIKWNTTNDAVDGQKNLTGLPQIFLDRGFIKNFGFGPLGSYRSHNCDQPTHLALQHLSMDMELVRKLSEVVREPEWHQNTQKYLVNLNEDPIDDFARSGITAELLARLTTDDIYYFGWCGGVNAKATEGFLGKHSLKGAVINVDDAATKTFDQQIQKIADEIYARYWQNNTVTAFLVTDNVALDVSGADKEGTADAEWPQGKWKIVHRPTDELGWDDGTEGTHILSGQYMSDLDFRFYLPGVYDIYYCDDLINSVTVHRAPTARLDVDMSDRKNPQFSDAKSFDPDDRSSNGIVKSEYTYIDVATMDKPKPGLPGTLEDGHTYLVTLTVTDKYGATATVARQLSCGYVDPADANPPYAYFTLEPSLIVKGTGGQAVDIINDSYDLYGDPITKYDFQVTKDGAAYGGLSLTGSAEGNHNVAGLPVGAYRVTLTVTSKNGVSQSFTRPLDVIQDTSPPTAAAAPPTGNFTQDTIINLRFKDQGGSGLKEQRFALTNSTAAPTAAQWSQYLPTSSRAVFLEDDGTHFIHWQAADNAGNKAEGRFGPYVMNKRISGMTLAAQPTGSQSYGSPVTLTAELDPQVAYDPKSMVYFFADGVPIGSQYITGHTAAIAYTPDAVKNIVFEARFYGDKAHKESKADLAYAVTKSDAAAVAVDPQIDREYNGHPYEVSHVSIKSAQSYKIEYRGTGGTVYPLSATPPVNAGHYEVVVTTTDPNYAEKTAAAPFEIIPRDIAVMLETDLPSGHPVAGETVRLTAVFSNTLELPPGTVTFTANGVTLATVAVRQSGSMQIAEYDWPNVPGGLQNLEAEYWPAAKDNYNGDIDFVFAYEITKAQQTGFDFPETTIVKTYGDPNFLLPEVSGGQGTGSVDYYQVAGDTVITFYTIHDDVSILQAGTAIIRAHKQGDGDYNSAAADLTV
ncbi:MAG: MBG domain-containing protein, partial [Gracilibacteraceae bacterium]|nr:MBG domain-containing protein [Gracilibacteraceae bacterium]